MHSLCLARHLRAAALVAAMLAPSAASAAVTYKVGPTQAHKQLADVADLLKPGDVVEVDGDATYTSVMFEASGSAAAKITIRGISKNGKRPVISGGNNSIEVFADHYVFENLDITGGSSRCFFHHGDDITVRGSVIHDCPKQGLLGADNDSGSLLLEYSEVHHCGGGTFDHQIYMATDEDAHPGSVFRMQFCYVHDANGGNSVKSRAERNEIYYNWIEGAVYHELELIGPDPDGGVAEDKAREDSDVVGNVLLKRSNFSVIRAGGDGTGQSFGRYRFANNTILVRPDNSAVFRLFDGIESIEMHNNVIVSAEGGAFKIKREVEADWATGSALIAGSNNWLGQGATDIPSQWVGTLTGADPKLQNAPADPRPVAGSPLIDAGAASPPGVAGHAFPKPLAAPLFHPPIGALLAPGQASARPVVGTIDIGAFEYGSGSGGSGGSGGAGGQGGSGQAGSGGSGQAGSGGKGGSAGSAGSAQAGQGGSAQAGSGGSAQAGQGGSSQAGAGGSAQAGDGGSSQAGAGGSAQAGDGGSSQAGAGGSEQAGQGGSSQAGSAGSEQGGQGGSEQAGSGGSAQAGDGGSSQAGQGGSGGTAGSSAAGKGGSAGSGGKGGSGGQSAGSSGSAGQSAGGKGGAGGSAGKGGAASGASGQTGAAPAADSGDDGGCGCRSAGGDRGSAGWAGALGLAAAAVRRRRAKRL